MAPPPSHPLTPDPQHEYAALKTPRRDAGASAAAHQPSQWSTKYWYLGSFAQLIALGSAGLYFVAACAYLTPYYWVLDPKIAVWWNVPTRAQLKANPKMSKGHAEMTLPTYLFLGLFVPFLLGVVAVHVLRRFNVRRITSHYLLRVARLLRRKPFAFGRVSPIGYGEWLFLVVFLLGGNVFVSWYQYDAYIAYVVEGGDAVTLDVVLSQLGLLLGYTCVWNMAFLFLPSTRNSAWMELLGISYANGIKYHRWVGVMVVVTGVAHTVPYYWIWLKEHRFIAEALPCFNCAVDRKSEGSHVWFNVFGELALLCFLAIAFTSLPIIRRRLFETFYYVHHLFLPGVLFTVLHWPTTTWFIFPSFLFYLIDRAVSSTNAFWPVDVVRLDATADGIVTLEIARSPLDTDDFAIGQFVYVNVPALSKLQWHPFTIASAPTTSKQSFTLLLKALGDWTQDFVTYAATCDATDTAPCVYIDGYYGESLDKYVDYKTLCLVAGGIGVTPLLAILEDMAATLQRSTAPSNVLRVQQQRVELIFSFRELSLLETLHPVLATLRTLDPLEQRIRYHLFLTTTPSAAALDEAIDYARLVPGRSSTNNTNALDTTPARAKQQAPRSTRRTATTMAFRPALRTPGVAAATHLFIVGLAVALVTYLQFGNGKIVDGGRKSQYWMVQAAVELSVLVVVAVVVVYLVVWLERQLVGKQQPVGANARNDTNDKVLTTNHDALAHDDLHTLRDLVATYNVTIDSRPDVSAIMHDVLDIHTTQQGNDDISCAGVQDVVGVFVSGPETLKNVTESAIATLGAHHFEVHAEEFEL